MRPIAPWLLTAAESSWRFSTSSTAASRLGLMRSRPAPRGTAQAARSAGSGFRVRRAIARVSGSWAGRAVTANSSAVLSTLARGSARGVAGPCTTVPLEGRLGGASDPGAFSSPPGALALGVLAAGVFVAGVFVAGAFGAEPFAGALAPGAAAALRAAEALPVGAGAESRTTPTAAAEPPAPRGDGIGTGTSLREPPKHAVPAIASTASSGACQRRLPNGNAKGSPVEDAHRIVPAPERLKCEKTGRAPKGDSGRRDAFSCHPATAADAPGTTV